MMNALLTQYNVQFYKQTSENNIRHIARGGGLAEFLDSYTDQESINEGLINVNYYLKGGIANYKYNTVSAELYTAWLDNSTADIYPSTGNTEHLLQSIPLQDFETILQLWLNFLKS